MRLKFGGALDSPKKASSKPSVVLLIYAHIISVASAVLPLTGYGERDPPVSNQSENNLFQV